MAVEVVEEVGATSVPTSSRVPRFFEPLRQRDFALLWTARSISLVGDQFYFLALAWLTLQLTGSALALGGVLMAAAIPRGALMLAGGAITDRFSPRHLMIASDVTRTALVGAVGILALTGQVQLWHLYALAAMFGAIDAVFYPCASAFVPLLVPEERLPAATALSEVSNRGSVLVGPGVAGLVIAIAGGMFGTGIAFMADAASFLLSAAALLFIRARTPRGGGAADEETAQPGFFRSIREGLRYAWRDPVIRYSLLIVAGIDVTLNGAFGVGLPLLARNQFSGGAAALGALDTGFGAGAVLGIIIAGSIATPRRRGLLIVGITAGFGVGTLLMPFMPNLPIAAAWMGAMAIGSGLANVLLMPWLQARTDPAMMGRVMSLFMFASFGLTPLSYAASGWIASVSTTLLFVSGGAIIFATASFALLNRTIRTID